jgi:hypothetical protein
MSGSGGPEAVKHALKNSHVDTQSESDPVALRRSTLRQLVLDRRSLHPSVQRVRAIPGRTKQAGGNADTDGVDELVGTFVDLKGPVPSATAM